MVCDNDYTTEEAYYRVYTTINLPSQDLKITLLSDDIQAGTATAPQSDISNCCGRSWDWKQCVQYACRRSIMVTTQESTTVATFANNDGWCRECACYTGLTNTVYSHLSGWCFARCGFTLEPLFAPVESLKRPGKRYTIGCFK